MKTPMRKFAYERQIPAPIALGPYSHMKMIQFVVVDTTDFWMVKTGLWGRKAWMLFHTPEKLVMYRT